MNGTFSLLSKIDNYLKPAIEIKEHNFSDNSLILTLLLMRYT